MIVFVCMCVYVCNPGTWRHLDGPMSRGSMQLRGRVVRGNWQFEGYWTLEEAPSSRHYWSWQPAPEGGASSGGWLISFVGSVAMDRYGVLCAWLFAALTSLQLLSKLFAWPHDANINAAANVLYANLYLSFLVAYGIMRSPPSWAFVIGVTCYWLGYIIFASVYLLLLTGPGGKFWYFTGSTAFLCGSVLLTTATEGALWRGSLCFTTGSLFFAADAASVGLGSYSNSVVGLVLFLLGRLFFILGSATPRCNACFCFGKHGVLSHQRSTSLPTRWPLEEFQAALETRPITITQGHAGFEDPDETVLLKRTVGRKSEEGRNHQQDRAVTNQVHSPLRNQHHAA